MASTTTISGLAKLLIDAIERRGEESALKLMAEKGISANKAISALAHKNVPISDKTKLRFVRTFRRRDVGKFGVEAPTADQLTQLAETIGDVGLRTKGAKVAKNFAGKPVTSAQAPVAAPPPAKTGNVAERLAHRTTTARTILERLRAERGERESIAKQSKEIGGKLGELQKTASKPRYFRAAGLLGAGLLAGTSWGGRTTPSQSAGQQMVAELLLNQKRDPDRQKLIDAQAELTKAKTAAIVAKLLGAVEEAEPKLPFT